jgi:hypothetical protein
MATDAPTFNPVKWAKDFLKAAKLPETQQNISAVVTWESFEGTFGKWNNPLDTTMPASGAKTVNSAGVKSYSSYSQGIAESVKTLYNGYYSGIISALKSGGNATAVERAVNASPWGTKITVENGPGVAMSSTPAISFQDYESKGLLTGGSDAPYKLKDTAGLWTKFWGSFGLSADPSYKQVVSNWNSQSATEAKKLGVNSTAYQTWASKTLQGLYGNSSKSALNIDNTSAPASPLSDISSMLGTLTKQGTWVRVGEAVVGGVLVIFGIYLLAKELGMPLPKSSTVLSIAKGPSGIAKQVVKKAATKSAEQPTAE